MLPKRLVWFTHLLSLFACSYVYDIDQDISHGTSERSLPFQCIIGLSCTSIQVLVCHMVSLSPLQCSSYYCIPRSSVTWESNLYFLDIREMRGQMQRK
jgi:hypothetical protein